MSRYLALIGTEDSEEAAAQAAQWALQLAEGAGWIRTWRRPGLDVWTAPGHRTPVQDLGGVVTIGAVLDRRGGDPVRRPFLPTTPVDAARRLRDDAWGGYIALLPGDRGWIDPWVYRDPSGALDAFAWRRGALALISDDVVGLPNHLTPTNIALDWDAISALVADPYATGHLSTLSGYVAVAPGALQGLRGLEVPAVQIWRPADYVRNTGEACPRRLRETVVETVSALARSHSRLLVDASGGLDSSIVAAALVAGGHRERVVAAVNHYPEQREGDERAWAKAVCDRLGLPLQTTARDLAPLTAEDFAELASHVGPAMSGLDTARDRDAAARACALSATAMFGGQGGDAVFFQLPAAEVVGDLVRAKGLRALTGPFVPTWARWLRRSVWSVLHEGLGFGGAATAAGWRRLLGPRGRDLMAPTHPWLQDLAALPPAKRLQIRAIVGTSHHHWGRARRSQVADVVQPLLAQPVVEFCLAIPTWRHVEGGRDRALARSAFAEDLPAVVIDRRSKGALGAHYARRAAASLAFLRPHLVDGALADAGVLDRAAISAALTPEALMWSPEAARLTRAALVESWVRHWQARAPDLPPGRR